MCVSLGFYFVSARNGENHKNREEKHTRMFQAEGESDKKRVKERNMWNHHDQWRQFKYGNLKFVDRRGWKFHDTKLR